MYYFIVNQNALQHFLGTLCLLLRGEQIKKKKELNEGCGLTSAVRVRGHM